MSKIIYYYKNDFQGALQLTVNNIRRALMVKAATLYGCLKLRVLGVKGCKSIIIGGVIRVERFPLSSIYIGETCRFNSNSLFNQRRIGRCIIQTGRIGAEIFIGDNCGFSGVSIVADKCVKIGNNVMVGANTRIGDRDDHDERLHTDPKPVVIGNNVFIGMGCTIMKGVTIGENSIIGACSVVTKSIPANSVAVGVPCKVIRKVIK